MNSCVDEIALKEKLTRNVLLREIFKNSKNSYLTWKRKHTLIKCLEYILKKEKPIATIGDEKAIIYCLLCLWYEGRVKNFNFIRAWKKHEFDECIYYADWYDAHIKQRQKHLSIIIV